MKKLTTEEFVKRFIARYPDMLGLDLSSFVYKKAKKTSKVRCIIHNFTYMASPDGMMSGIKGCKLCKSSSISLAQKYTNDTFIQKSKERHGDRYDYSLVAYKSIRNKVKIICKRHGLFEQNPQGHWKGYGCPHPECSHQSLRKTTNDFIRDAIKVHGDRYDYTRVFYRNNYSNLVVICKNHGDFFTSRRAHILYQRGCPKCFKGNRSWAEIQWLESLGVSECNRQKRIKIKNKSFYVDGLVNNTVYEFWGDYWHGNPNVFNLTEKNTTNGRLFGELYNKTMEKRKIILEAGYQLVEIWENDFRNIIKNI